MLLWSNANSKPRNFKFAQVWYMWGALRREGIYVDPRGYGFYLPMELLAWAGKNIENILLYMTLV